MWLAAMRPQSSPAGAGRSLLLCHIRPAFAWCRSGSRPPRASRVWLRHRACAHASAASDAAPPAAATEGSCYGCGIPLQTLDPQLVGYVQPEKYLTKKKHRQLDQLLCTRCQDLSNGAMIPAVADFAQTKAASPQQATGFEGKRLLTPEQLRQSLKVVRGARALVVLLVDLLDVSGSLLGRVRDLVGSNPIVLLGTKADLLPDGTQEHDVAEWLQAAAAFKKINAVSVHLVSARTGSGVSEAVAAIRRERRGRDVYVIGAANVGKSAFVRALVRDMSSITSRQYDPQATARAKYLPVESAMPGTTLQLIPMEVFAAGGVLYDTPGLHLHHRMPHILTPEENKLLHPRRRLRPYLAPPLEEALAGGEQALAASAAAGDAGPAAGQQQQQPLPGRQQRQPLPGRQQQQAGAATGGRSSAPLCSYMWGGLVRIDMLQGPPSLQLVFYGPPVLRVTAGGQEGLAALQQGPASEEDEPAFGSQSVALRGGLRLAKRVSLSTAGGSSSWQLDPLADISVSGVPGWVTVLAGGRGRQQVELEVWAPVGVEAFSRPALPVPLPIA